MNDRQTELLHKLLVHKDEVFRVQSLADELECSEKTLRNDLKLLEQFLQTESAAYLVRKPGIGISLVAPEEEKAKLFNRLYQTEKKTDQDRKLELAYRMLVEEKAFSLNELAADYYTTIPMIKNDLDVIRQWLESYHLQIISKQRLGSKITGEELDKRNALAHLSELVDSRADSNQSVIQLFPGYEVDIVSQLVRQLEQRFSFHFAEGEKESLVIHALVMIKRTRQNSLISIKDDEKASVHQTQEYEMAEWFFHRLGEVLRIKFPIEEQVYFTWHLISCKSPEWSASSTDPFVSEVIDQLTFQMQIMTMKNFRDDRVLMDGLQIHLASTIHRVRYGLTIRNPMLSQIKKMYPYMFSMVVMGLEEVKRKYELAIPEDEAAYLVLHFQAAVERLEKRRNRMKHVLIVCELGIGMSHLLQAKLEQTYKGLDIVGCVAERNVDSTLKQSHVDFIISTKPLQVTDPPHIVISPLLEAEDKKQLDRFLQSMDENGNKGFNMRSLIEYIHEDFCILKAPFEHRFKVIEGLADVLSEKGRVKPTFGHRTLLRERSSATAIGGGIAIPHAPSEEVHQTTIAIVTLDEPLVWGDEKVTVVFMLAIAPNDQKRTRPLMQAISKISEHPELVEKIRRADNFSEMKQVLLK
ncbi:BglG family transcription antiterminator [Halobacillus sp. H74]|uniref:BglG family transcription antiterminator n=1 Tax=Halobacillus sp. H74 TaxID=3457436 RepID=UPI003FCEAA70